MDHHDLHHLECVLTNFEVGEDGHWLICEADTTIAFCALCGKYMPITVMPEGDICNHHVPRETAA